VFAEGHLRRRDGRRGSTAASPQRQHPHPRLQATVLVDGSRPRRDPEPARGGGARGARASLAYAAINPAIGLGAFLAQWC
jgi:hypothetical protein